MASAVHRSRRPGRPTAAFVGFVTETTVVWTIVEYLNRRGIDTPTPDPEPVPPRPGGNSSPAVRWGPAETALPTE